MWHGDGDKQGTRLRERLTCSQGDGLLNLKEDHRMGKSKLKTCIVLFAFLLLASPAYSQTSKVAAPSSEPIKIGGSLSLTGYASEQAKWVKAGYESWAEDINRTENLIP
jgi:ABC-type branched-subunit amino acid transport system substrate-binding protein